MKRYKSYFKEGMTRVEILYLADDIVGDMSKKRIRLTLDSFIDYLKQNRPKTYKELSPMIWDDLERYLKREYKIK